MKRMISALLCLALLLSISPVFGVNAAPSVTTTVPWDGRSSEPFAGGSGTAEDPYQIANGAQLYSLALAADTSGYYVLTNNINLGSQNFPMIPNFSGTLDGQNYRIINLYILNKRSYNTGLVQICSGTIKNLTLEGYVEGTYPCGAVAGKMSKGNILNCTNYCEVTCTDGATGGIVGTIDSGSVKNCVNRGTINGTKTCGGIAGGGGVIENCINGGTINGQSVAGGIVGAVSSSGGAQIDQSISVSSCVNVGNVNGGSKVGGIVGSQNGSTIRYCVNVGTVTATSNNVGGIIGYGYACSCKDSSGRYYTTSTYVHDCYNTAKVTGSDNVGGLIGSYTYCARITEGFHHSYKPNAGAYRLYNIGEVVVTKTDGYSGDIHGSKGATDVGVISCSSVYYIDGKNPSTNVITGTAHSQDDMMSIVTYSNFDFNSVWTWDYSNTYLFPILQSVGLPPTLCNHEYALSATSASCVSSGIHTYTCTICQDQYFENTPAQGHDIHSFAAKQPSCTEVGWEEYTACSRCDYATYSELPMLGHDIVIDAAVAPSCTEAGLTEGSHCTRCDDVTVKQEIVAATGHSYETGVTPPTCTVDGYTTHTCTVCGYSYTDTPVEATGHNWDAGTNTATPTCTEKGTTVYTCLTCGETREESIPENGHSYSSTVTPPTCTEEGYTTYVCSVCGHSYKGNMEEATGHEWNAGITTVNPSCENEGKKIYTCHTCGETKEEILSETGHSYKAKITKPTCTAVGYTTHTCSACGDSYKDTYVGATGHTWNQGIEMTKATCTTAGEKVYTCGNCGETRAEEIPSPGHSYSAKITAPTCTDAGYTTYTCTSCGDSYTGDTVAATGHSFEEGTCTVCDAEDPNYVPNNPFTDVKEADYFYDPVLWAVKKGITTGTSATTFSPNNPCTRGQVVTFLWRACGSPEPTSTKNPFADVAPKEYYYKAVLWAVEEGITTGLSSTKFGPNETCTRGQVATFLWRAQGKPTPTTTTNPFTDIKEADYYYSAVLWAVEEGVTNGTGKGLFSPDKDCTRGQIVTFLYRALSKE